MEKNKVDEYKCPRCKEKYNFKLPESGNPALNRLCADCAGNDMAELELVLINTLTEKQLELYEKIIELRSHITSYWILSS